MKRSPLKRKTPLRARKPTEMRPRKVRSFGGGPRLPKRTMRKPRPKATPEEQAHLGAVARLGCIVSRNLKLGYRNAALHHVRTGYGMGERASHWEVLPLTPERHQNGGMGVAFHAGPRTWQAKFGTEIALLKQVYELLGIPFEKLPELRGSKPPWWEAFERGDALESNAALIFNPEEADGEER